MLFKVNQNIEDSEILYTSSGLNDIFNYSNQEFKIIINEKNAVKTFFKKLRMNTDKFFRHVYFGYEEKHSYHIKINDGYVWISTISKTIDYVDGYDIVLSCLFETSHETMGYESLIEDKETMYIVYALDTKNIIYFVDTVTRNNNYESVDLNKYKIHELFKCSSYEEFLDVYINNDRYVEYKDHYYKLKLKNIFWREIPSEVLIVDDVTSVVVKTKEIEEAYKKRIKSIMSNSKKGEYISTIDLSSNSVIDYNIGLFGTNPKSADDILFEVSIHIGEIDLRKNIPFERKSLLEMYKNGKYVFTYPIKNRMDGLIKVENVIVQLVENPTSNHIEAYIYINDATDESIDSALNRVIINDRHCVVGIISPELSRMYIHRINRKYGVYFGQKEYDYLEGMGIISEAFFDTDQEELTLQSISLSSIINKLSIIGNKFSFVTKIKKEYSKSGSDTFLKLSYYYIGDNNEAILFTIEDLTSDFEKDPITNFLNRNGFEKELNRLLSNDKFVRTNYALVYFNISGFKAFNEQYGHAHGDELLRDVLITLSNSELEPVLSSRFDADNFVLFLHKQHVNIEYIKSLSRVYDNKQYGAINLKCGIYYLTEDKSLDISSMYDRAKLASEFTYGDKINNVIEFKEDMADEYIDRNAVITRFNDALLNKEFVVYYQPIVDAKTKNIISAEALVRWKKQDGTLIPPGQFIPLLEESGYIAKLDQYVIDDVTNLINRRINEDNHIIPISINLSRKDFSNSNNIDLLVKKFTSNNPYKYLRIELTESDYTNIENNAKDFFSKIRENGGVILLDDFGSGLSSFSTLRDYEFDIIKLDRGFICRIGDSEKNEKIITSVLDMAKKMGLKVIAEGVETKEQVELLKNNDCDYFQGFYFYKPIPEDEFIKLLDN